MATEGRSSQDLSDWLQREHGTLMQLSKVIKEHIALTPEVNLGEWLNGLGLAFERLKTHLTRNFEAQESGGYLHMVLDHRPSLSPQVEQIKAEHGQLLHMAERLRSELSQTRPEQRLLVADLSARILRFLAIVAQHEQRENMITLLVFNQDIGTGD